MSKKCGSRDGEGRKEKGGGGGSRSKTKLCVTKLYVMLYCIYTFIVYIISFIYIVYTASQASRLRPFPRIHKAMLVLAEKG